MVDFHSGLLNLVFPILSIARSSVANTTFVFNKGKNRLKNASARERELIVYPYSITIPIVLKQC